jgi:hypothetical protein
MFVTHRARRWVSLALGVVCGLVLAHYGTLQARAALPSLFITSPASGTVVGGTVPLWARADASGLSSLQFEVSGQPVGTLITSGSCTAAWDTRTVADGVHTVTAVGRDSGGASVWAQPLTVTVSNAPQVDTTAPSIAITSPGAGSALSGTVTVFASASDNVGVASVWFTLDGATVTPNLTVTQGVASWTWNTTTASPGTHVLTASARDGAGNVGTSVPVTVTLAASTDSTAPTVSIASPPGGATVTGSVIVTATAADNVGVAGVRFTIDGTPFGTEDLTSPYQVTWNTTSASNGGHSIRAIARDAAGNTTTSAAVAVTVGNTSADLVSPTVNLTAPSSGATVSGSVTVSASAADNVGVASVQFTLDGANLGAADTSAPYQVTWSTAGVANGSHVLGAVARDAAGNATTASSLSVTVSNQTTDTTRPTVSMTAPGWGATVNGDVTVVAAASDNVGVVGVQFTLDGAPLGAEDLTAPYQITWNTLATANGVRTLRAVARDAAGNSRTSFSRSVVVSNTIVDTSVPSVAITSPTGGSTIAGTITLTASASDDRGVVGVQFKADGVNIGAEDTSAPYQVSWAAGSALNGLRTITATARDLAGKSSTATIQLIVNNLGSGVPGDFDSDGRPDLLFMHPTGALYAWFMREGQLQASEYLTPNSVNPDWRVASIDDFNGDRKSDILWQHQGSGLAYVWFMDGTTRVGGASIGDDYGSAWRVAASGDLNADGKTDLVWHNSNNGELVAMLLDGVTILTTNTLTPGFIDPAWRVAGMADVTRDGRADLVWQNMVTGALAYWQMNGLTAVASGPLTPGTTDPVWVVKAVADFDKDGSPDLVWQHAQTGDLYIWYMSGTTNVEGTFLTPARVNPAWQIVGSR